MTDDPRHRQRTESGFSMTAIAAAIAVIALAAAIMYVLLPITSVNDSRFAGDALPAPQSSSGESTGLSTEPPTIEPSPTRPRDYIADDATVTTTATAAASATATPSATTIPTQPRPSSTPGVAQQPPTWTATALPARSADWPTAVSTAEVAAPPISPTSPTDDDGHHPRRTPWTTQTATPSPRATATVDPTAAAPKPSPNSTIPPPAPTTTVAIEEPKTPNAENGGPSSTSNAEPEGEVKLPEAVASPPVS